MWDGLVDQLKDFGLWLMERIGDIIKGVLDAVIETFIETLKDLGYWLLNWLIEMFNDNIYPILEWVADKIGPLLPADWMAPVVEFLHWMSIINSWIPLDFGFMLFSAYYGIKFAAMIFKWIAAIVLNLIP